MVVRNLRHEALNELKKLEKDKEISQDEYHRAQEQLQKLTDSHIIEIDELGKEKEKELMEV